MASIRDLLDEAVKLYGRGDIDGLAQLYADDAVFTVPGVRLEGRDQIRGYWAGLFQAFPDGGTEILRNAETGDMFFAEIMNRGTHTGQFTLPDGTALPPTGKSAELPGMLFVRVRDGKLVEENTYYDSLTMMSQLGLMPG